MKLRFVSSLRTRLLLLVFLALLTLLGIAQTAPIRNLVLLGLTLGLAAGAACILAFIIVKRRKSDQSFLQSADTLQALINVAPVAVVVLDKQGCVHMWNQASERIFGWRAGEVIGRPLPVVPPEKQTEFRAILDRVIRGQPLEGQELQGNKKDGTTIDISLVAVPLRDARRRVTGALGIVADITERKRIEIAEKESRLRLENMIESAMDAIITVDEEQRIVLFNDAAEQMFGYSAIDMFGKSVDRLIPERLRDIHCRHIQRFGQLEVFKRPAPKMVTVTGLRANGEEFPAEASFSQVTVAGRRFYTAFLRDLTDKKRIEAQFLRAQRLESIGTLAGGIAHDLNNVLAPILLAAQMLQEETHSESGRALLNTLESSVLRGANIVKQVLTFARGVEGQKAPVQLRHLIKEMASMIRETFPKSITLQSRTDPDLWMISGDATQLHQVLMNLSVNARDAMPDGGVLTLTAENVRLDESFASSAPDAKAGPYVLLEVSDTGTGISPDILDKIFDPFFTTKSPDRGTGLGLSTVTGIVKGHGGFMQVFSQVGKGSKFNVYLPAAEVQLAPPRTESVTLPRGSGELILVIDDEEGVCEIIRKTLGKNGYQVLTAKDGAQGIAAYDANRANVKLVLVDLAMPVMNGEVTIRALKDLNPQVRCIVASGLAMPANPALLSQLGACGFLQKPFTSEALLRIIHQGLQEQVP